MNADWQEAQTFQRKLHLSLTHRSHLEFTSEFATNSQELQELCVCVCVCACVCACVCVCCNKEMRKRRELRVNPVLPEPSAWPEKTHTRVSLTGVTVNGWSLTYPRLPGTLPILLSLVHSVPLSPWQECHIFYSHLKFPTTPLILSWWHCLLFPVRIRNSQKRPSACSCPTVSRKLCLWATSAPVAMHELSMDLAEVHTYSVPSPGAFSRMLLPPMFHLFPT